MQSIIRVDPRLADVQDHQVTTPVPAIYEIIDQGSLLRQLLEIEKWIAYRKTNDGDKHRKSESVTMKR